MDMYFASRNYRMTSASRIGMDSASQRQYVSIPLSVGIDFFDYQKGAVALRLQSSYILTRICVQQ
jgi:hypothetical protein